jgi:two-component system NtrC family sensor kinase
MSETAAPARVVELTRTVEQLRRTIDALIIAAERRTAEQSDGAAVATWQRNLSLQQRIVERTNRVRIAEQLLRSVIDSLDTGLCILAADGTIIDTNREWAEMLGAGEGGGLGVERHTSFFSLAEERPAGLGALLAEAAMTVREILAGREAASGPGHRVLVQGDERWWKMRVDRVRGHEEAQAVVTLEDITGQMRIQEELRQATRIASRLALVARHTGDAVVITDGWGVIEWVNDAFVKMSGFSSADAVGQLRTDLLHNWQPQAALENHVMTEGQVVFSEFKTRAKDGRPYWLRIELYRVLDDDGEVRFVGVEHDVTDRRAEEDALMTAIGRSDALADELSTEKAVLTGVISAIPHLTYWKDNAGRYHGHNEAFLAMRGVPRGTDLIGRTDDELGSQDDFSRTLVEIEYQVMTTGQAVIDQRVVIPRSHGDTRTVLMSVLPQPDATGQTSGLIGVGADVTRISELERQLNQTNRLESIGQLAAGISHEINTPIQFVSDNTRFVAQSFAQMLLLVRLASQLCTQPTGDEAAQTVTRLREVLEDIDVEFLLEEIPGALTESLEGLDRVAQIVRAMKDFSHPGQGRHATDINRAIENTAQVARNEWKYHAVLDLRLGTDVGLVPCYEGELKQVILNLIVNAAHAIEAKGAHADGGLGHIEIRTARFDDHVEIAVADDGTGMDEATKQHIFDPFFTTKEVGKGTGQGLSMAYASIVQKHGGAIQVESAPGSGTKFVIILPAHIDSPAPTP